MNILIVTNDDSENMNYPEKHGAGPAQEQNVVRQASQESYLSSSDEDRHMNIGYNLTP